MVTMVTKIGSRPVAADGGTRGEETATTSGSAHGGLW
jgi:hypothetical protein